MRLARRSSRSHPPGTCEPWPLTRLPHSQILRAFRPALADQSPPPSPADHHNDPPAPASRALQPLAPIENGGPFAITPGLLGGVGFDLVLASPADDLCDVHTAPRSRGPISVIPAAAPRGRLASLWLRLRWCAAARSLANANQWLPQFTQANCGGNCGYVLGQCTWRSRHRSARRVHSRQFTRIYATSLGPVRART
jgi:hypothetical protein